MNAFSKILGLSTLVLCAVVAITAALWPESWPPFHGGFGVAGVLLMAANTYAAIAILKIRTGMEPVQLIMLSMLIRLGIVAAVMLAVIQFVSQGPALYSFVFSAMLGFVAFQAVEIRHIIRHPELLAK